MALRRYLRAEQKEQRHTLRHYQHVAAVDPEKAQQMRFQVPHASGPRMLTQHPLLLPPTPPLKNVPCMVVLLVYLFTTCMPGLWRGQERVLSLLELELQTVVSRVDAGN